MCWAAEDPTLSWDERYSLRTEADVETDFATARDGTRTFCCSPCARATSTGPAVHGNRAGGGPHDRLAGLLACVPAVTTR